MQEERRHQQVKQKIDGYWYSPDMDTISVQIKSCNKIHSTRNMIFDLRKGNPPYVIDGWPRATKAKMALIFSPKSFECWMFYTKHLKENIDRYERDFRHHTVIEEVEGDDGVVREFPCTGVIVPLTETMKDLQPRYFNLKETYGK